MITRLEVDGFKSLCDFSVDLEPFTVFIGPNSAGKSNILDALALLSRLSAQSQPIVEAFKRGRGEISDQFTRHGGEPAKAIRFAVEFLEHYSGYESSPVDETAQSRFRYELTIGRQALRSGVERLVVQDEHLFAMRRQDDTWLDSHPAFAEFAAYAKSGPTQAGTDCLLSMHESVFERRSGSRAFAQDAEESRRPKSLTAMAQLIRFDMPENLRSWRFLQLDRARLGEPCDRIGSGDLEADLSNLPRVLAGLSPLWLGEIRAELVSLVPGLASFEVVPDGDQKLRIDFELSGGERMPARLVSDGTNRVLALLTALRMEPRPIYPFLMGIEQPEDGIYPGRLRALLALLREKTAQMQSDRPLPTQLLLTTHSPVILAALRAHPQQLRFVDTVRRDGRRLTRVRTVAAPGSPGPHRLTIAPQEIDQLLNSTTSELPE